MKNFFHRHKKLIIAFIIILLFQTIKHLTFAEYPYFSINGDACFYIYSLENLFNTGVYHYNQNFAGRMPGFLPIYIPLRFVFSQSNALTVFVFLQLLLYSLSVILLSNKIVSFFKLSRNIFYFIVVLLGLSDYCSTWASGFYTEALAVTCILFGLFFLLSGIDNHKKLSFFLSGCFFAWMVFLRPFMLAPLLGFVFFLLMYLNYSSIKRRLLIMLFFIAPFMISCGIWTIRNYFHSNKIIPLQSTMYAGISFTQGHKAYRKFITSVGEDLIPWNPGSLGMWFQPDSYIKKFNFNRPDDKAVPKYIFKNTFNIDSLKKLRAIYWLSIDTTLDLKKRELNDSVFAQRMNNITIQINREHPFRYYFVSPLKLMYKFSNQPYTYYLPLTNRMQRLQYAIKTLIYILNAFTIIFGSIMFVWLVFKKLLIKFDKYYLLLFISPLFIIIYFPAIFRFIEYRMMSLQYPFYAIFAAIGISFLMDKFNKYIQLKKKLKFKK